MAGKSKRGKNRKSLKAANPLESSVSATASEPVSESEPHGNETETGSSVNEPKQGLLHPYPVSIKTLNGLTLELQLSPAETVMDIRQFLLDAPETCFFTCYYLYLCTKDGLTHKLEDHIEISEVTDITAGSCFLEMVSAYYDNRSIRAHVQRARKLISLSTLHASLSTSLASEYQRAQNRVPDTAKTEIPELDALGFMEDVTGSLGKLIPSPSEEIKCVESISFSSFNPPPSYRRIVGDLIYLDVVTLEGNTYCVTGTTESFYVNSSTGDVLDSKPSKASSKAATLIGLLQKISSKFRKAFREILERKASAHPFENVHSLLPPNSWLGSYPVPDHRRDAARAEDALTLPYGSASLGMQRDWNEELQSCRDFSQVTPRERIFRDRALYKVTSDFVNAAKSGAIGVLSGCIPPINPTDPECFHMYVHNGIFFSFAVDADLEQILVKHKMDNTVEETQLAESERATYASTNNDLKGTKAYQEADVPGLYILPMAIIDYKGHRVVAQSALPRILRGDKSDSLLYGSIDNGKTICWNGDFHSKVLEAAKNLHLKEHSVVDESGNAFKLASAVESKGLVGSDNRHYLLDLMRVTPRDANYTGPGSRFFILRPELITAFCQVKLAERIIKSVGEAHATTSSSATAGVEEQIKPREDGLYASCDDTGEAAKDIPRSGCEAHATTNSSATSGAEEQIQPKDGLYGSSVSNDMIQAKVETVEEKPTPARPKQYEEILFNPNVLTEFKLSGSPEEITKDEENVKQASSFLANTVLPKLIQDLCALEVSPNDGQTLTQLLHERGINVRYIGKVAEGIKHLPHLWDLYHSEIVVRSAKHIFKHVLRETEDQDVGPAISHFFNCFFGNCQAVSRKGVAQPVQQNKELSSHHSSRKSSGLTRSKGATVRKSLSWYLNFSSESIWSDIKEFAKIKYQFELPEDARAQVKRVSVLRNLCLKVGVKITARKYDLKEAAPFQVSDILDLQPVVKHSTPICSYAKELVAVGKMELSEDRLTEAYALLSEAYSVLQQVTGPLHPKVVNCCRFLATVLHKYGDMAEARTQQHKELIINERCLGLDHPDTAHSYGNMTTFYIRLNQTGLALQHVCRTLLILSLCCGPDHPDIAVAYLTMSTLYQRKGKMNTGLRYLQEALKMQERCLGKEHIQTALTYHALAVACSCMGALKLSLQHEKRSYDILVKQVGEEDERTQESLNWIERFKKAELEGCTEAVDLWKVLEAAKRLHLKEHTVVDESENVFKLASPVESKGIVGGDDRHYLFDLVRVTPRDANYTGPGSRFCILRPELITAFCQGEAAKKNSRSGGEAHATTISSASAGAEEHIQPKLYVSSDSNDMIQEKTVETVEGTPTTASPELKEEMLFNPNVLTEFKLSGSPEEIMEDEENVRKASSFLTDTVLPKFIQDLCTLEVSPLDGQSLTEAMHEQGINVRYIGKVAEGTKHLPHLWDVCYSEIVVRSAKHIFKDVLRATEYQDLGQSISLFFNCFFGNCQSVSIKGIAQPIPQKEVLSSHGSSGKSSRQTRSKRATVTKILSWCIYVSSESLWSDIKDFAKIKYQFELPEDAREQAKRVSVLRSFCLKVGVKIAARKYDLTSATPFEVSDILDLQPVVKHSIPICSDAKELVEAGKIELKEGRLTEAYTLFSEAFSLLQQVTGPMHPEVANCCRYLAAVLTKSGDTAGAIIQQHKELIINERCLGLDHPNTAHSYANIAISYRGLSQTELAFEHMSRALLLLSLSAGPNHPDIATTFLNLSMMYQDIGQMNTSLRYLQEALKLNERLLGTEHIQTAMCYHSLAIACSLMGALKLSIQHEKKNYDILVKQLGEEHLRTRDSLNLIETFKKLELKKQLEQDVEEVSEQEAIDLFKANPDVVQALKAALAADEVENEAKNVKND